MLLQNFELFKQLLLQKNSLITSKNYVNSKIFKKPPQLYQKIKKIPNNNNIKKIINKCNKIICQLNRISKKKSKCSKAMHQFSNNNLNIK